MSTKTNNLWFKRRRYGWGWTPTTWQGWLTILIFLVVMIASPLAFLPMKPTQPAFEQLLLTFGLMGTALVTLIALGLIKGPRPHWRWGKKDIDHPDEDF